LEFTGTKKLEFLTDIAPLRELLRRAVLTMFVVPDSDAHYRRGLKTAWPEFVRHQRDAYGWASPAVKMFEPTRHDLTVYLEAWSWLDWYQRAHPVHGEETAKNFIRWCRGASNWQLQERTTTNRRRPCSAQTVKDRRDAMILAIASHFPDATRKCVDNYGELEKFAGTQLEDAELSSDLRDLPKPPKNWRSAPVPLSHSEQASAHVALEKRLRKNGSRALKRAGK
jgi:hypothetical protein